MANDYISRDAAIALTDQHCFESGYDAVWMEEALKDVPAADVVEVVRCKDCKFYTQGTMRMCCARGYIDFIYLGDFCSRGVRRKP